MKILLIIPFILLASCSTLKKEIIPCEVYYSTWEKMEDVDCEIEITYDDEDLG